MSSYIYLGLSHLIEPEYLGLHGGYDGDPVENRFGVLFAKKRNQNNQFIHETLMIDGEERTVDAKYGYMVDHASNDLYILHRPYELPHYFFLITLLNPFVTAGSLTFNIALIVGRFVQGIFEAVKSGIVNRDELRDVITNRYEEIKEDIHWLGKTIQYGVAMQATAIYALTQIKNPDELFAMKVAIARIEFLWNREEDFHHACLTKMLQRGKQFLAALSDETESNALAELIEIIQKMAFSDFFTRTFYAMQCFQSRGHQGTTIGEEGKIAKFEKVREFETYEDYVLYSKSLDERRKSFQQESKKIKD